MPFGTEARKSQVPSNKSTCGDSAQPLCRLLGRLAAEIATQAPELAKVLVAWPKLPEHAKRAILALVTAVGEEREESR